MYIYIYIYILNQSDMCLPSQHYLVGFLSIQKIRQKMCPFLEKQSVYG